LNNVDHKDLRVITTRGAEYGDDVMFAMTFPAEFRNVQAHYPIAFRKAADGQFQPLALFGFEERQNLFLTRDGWDATYLPLMIERLPFLIGKANGQLVIHIDMDSPRVSETEGEPVFLEHGGTSPYLERIGAILEGIHTGVEASKAMFAELEHFNLIEPVKVEVKVSDEEHYDLVGLYTISEERLRALDGDALVRLNRSGLLHGAYLVLSSMNNMKKLIDLKQNRLRSAARAS